MKHLILMRHAKSGWEDPDLDDHDRPLSPRGQRSAPLLGDWLAQNAPPVDTVLCSTANRTRQTWALVSEHLTAPSEIRFEPALYLASPDRMRDILTAVSGNVVLMVAHNPGIAILAEMLAATPPDHAQWHRYPTGATVVLAFQAAHWAAIKTYSGAVVGFTVPRDLA